MIGGKQSHRVLAIFDKCARSTSLLGRSRNPSSQSTFERLNLSVALSSANSLERAWQREWVWWWFRQLITESTALTFWSRCKHGPPTDIMNNNWHDCCNNRVIPNQCRTIKAFAKIVAKCSSLCNSELQIQTIRPYLVSAACRYFVDGSICDWVLWPCSVSLFLRLNIWWIIPFRKIEWILTWI